MGRRRDEGFALIEGVVAAALAAIAVAGVAATMAVTSKANGSSRAATASVAIARARVEAARSLGYEELVHASGSLNGDPNVVAGMFDPDGVYVAGPPATGGPMPAEAIVYGTGAFSTPVATETRNSILYTARTYITTAGSAKRITALVTFDLNGVPRTTTMSSLVSTAAAPLAAAAQGVSGRNSTGVLPDVATARARKGGGTETVDIVSTSPVPGWTLTGVNATVDVDPGVSHHAQVQVSSASLSVTGITISASGINSTADATASGITTSSTGTVTINGIPYVNPAVNLVLEIGTWAVYLNHETTDPDGSRSISFLRLIGPSGEDIRLAWTWVAPLL